MNLHTRYILIERLCSLCGLRHELAIRTFGSGRVGFDGNPSLNACYSCLLAECDPDQRVMLQNVYQMAWRRATDKPFPEALV